MDNLIHVWQRCHGCGQAPIMGDRYDCQTCPTGPHNHLCAPCHALYAAGRLAHPATDSYASHTRVSGVHVFMRRVGTSARLLEAWRETCDAVSPPPRVADGFVVRPEFFHSNNSYCGSYAFIAESPDTGDSLLITALHVLDELIKSAVGVDALNLTGADVARLVTGVRVYDAFARQWMLAPLGLAHRMVAIASTKLGEDEPFCQSDMAVFVPEHRGALPPGAPLAARSPSRGDPIWLAVNMGPAGGRVAAATVIESSGAALVFRFRSTEQPMYSSGAPLLRHDGAVVGINVGGGTFGGHRYGHGVHVASMRHHLANAVSDWK